jgi:metal-responsive CopG/Arc/MetJ family transcriptional regulator
VALGSIIVGMRVKTSVTIDEEILDAIDRAATPGRSRSRIIEDAAREYLSRQARLAREARDRELIDGAADALNAEMEDVLSYQADL